MAGRAAEPATPFNRNLLQNGGAETPSEVSAIPGWQDTEGLTEQPYGATPGEWARGVSGCTACGRFYMRLAFGDDRKSVAANQLLTLHDISADIDSGRVTAVISGFIGTMLGSHTGTQILASFQDATGKNLGQLAVETVTANNLPAPKAGKAAVAFRTKTGPVPAGTRQILFQWQAKPAGDAASYLAFADNLSLVLKRM